MDTVDSPASQRPHRHSMSSRRANCPGSDHCWAAMVSRPNPAKLLDPKRHTSPTTPRCSRGPAGSRKALLGSVCRPCLPFPTNPRPRILCRHACLSREVMVIVRDPDRACLRSDPNLSSASFQTSRAIPGITSHRSVNVPSSRSRADASTQYLPPAKPDWNFMSGTTWAVTLISGGNSKSS